MQIFLTKKLAAAMGAKPADGGAPENLLFAWTANWTNTFADHGEDMLVMTNNATRFPVVIYGVKRAQVKKAAALIPAAIRHTMEALHLNPEAIDAYFAMAGEITFAPNRDRRLTAQLNKLCLSAALIAGEIALRTEDVDRFDDTLGRIVGKGPVKAGDGDAYIYPIERMEQELAKLTGKPAYKYPAFELLVTLDLEAYKLTRRLIVPADIAFDALHLALQDAVGWENAHLYEFVVRAKRGRRAQATLMPYDDGFPFGDGGDEMRSTEDHKLSEYFPEFNRIDYIYDMGDGWEHEIKLVRVIKEHDADSPYLLEASGNAPPEDVGGVGGYLRFLEILANPDHPEYEDMKSWGGFWTPEPKEWRLRPRLLGR